MDSEGRAVVLALTSCVYDELRPANDRLGKLVLRLGSVRDTLIGLQPTPCGAEASAPTPSGLLYALRDIAEKERSALTEAESLLSDIEGAIGGGLGQECMSGSSRSSLSQGAGRSLR